MDEVSNSVALAPARTGDTPIPSVAALVRRARTPGRDPRSKQYWEGLTALLAHRIDGVKIPHPYAMGTVEADAFWSGTDEGRHIWAEVQSQIARAA